MRITGIVLLFSAYNLVGGTKLTQGRCIQSSTTVMNTMWKAWTAGQFRDIWGINKESFVFINHNLSSHFFLVALSS